MKKTLVVSRKCIVEPYVQCGRACKAQFSVTVGTTMEDSHLPLAKWVKAFHFMVSSKKEISALQLQPNLGLGSYKTAWHLAHRIRYAMSDPKHPILKGDVQIDKHTSEENRAPVLVKSEKLVVEPQRRRYSPWSKRTAISIPNLLIASRIKSAGCNAGSCR